MWMQMTRRKKVLWTLAIIFFVINIVFLPRTLMCLSYKFLIVESDKSRVVFCRDRGVLGGESMMVLSVERAGQWFTIGHVEDAGFGVVYPSACWSKDRSVLIAQDDDKGNFAYDFTSMKAVGTDEMQQLIKSRGGRGEMIFSDIAEFNRLSRYPLWWDLSWISQLVSGY